MNRQVVGLAPEVVELFRRYWWPGNVRELLHAIEHAMTLEDSEVIMTTPLPPEIMDGSRPTVRIEYSGVLNDGETLQQHLDRHGEECWTPLCSECRDLGWLFIDGHGVKECMCRVQARIARRLERIAPECGGLRLEVVTPDLNRHPRQALIWKTVRNNPDGHLICGRSGAGKTTILQALYSRAVLLDRPAVAVSLANLLGDYRRAELAKYEDEYVPLQKCPE
jgi:ABC-type multidrug transport system fused ATPase/permease subunit